jgi:hypothetical protein
MTTLQRQSSQIEESLARLPIRLAAAFAAAAAERQVPNYAAYVDRSGRGNLETLVRVLQDLWDDLEYPSGQKELLRADFKQCESLAQDDGRYENGWRFAKNAIRSTQHAIRLWMEGEVGDGVWASDLAIDTLYTSTAIPIDDVQMRTISWDEHEALIATPLVQAEYRREHQDLADLTAGAGTDPDQMEAISKVRRRAQTDALRFLDRDAAAKSLGLT